MNFCSNCGSGLSLRIPRGDSRKRFICDDCETIHYQNPRIVTGCLVTWNDRVLLCKRAINPRSGLWTLPAGFLENGETAQEGAARETWEEACARVKVNDLYTMFSLPHISQVYMFYRAELVDGVFSAGEETAEAGLFEEQDIPWSDLAFPVIEKTLELFFRDRTRDNFPVHTHDIIISRENRS
jgi:ADP-ribose pyrophosphatase YjhB (NUDIX family)